MNTCLFCKIAEGEIPSHDVYEDEKVKAFLEINPAHEGHILIIPKKHAPTIYDLKKDEYSYLMSMAQKIGPTLKEIYNAKKVALLVYGMDVLHAHIHLIPLTEGDEITLKQKETPSKEHLIKIAEKIRHKLNS